MKIYDLVRRRSGVNSRRTTTTEHRYYHHDMPQQRAGRIPAALAASSLQQNQNWSLMVFALAVFMVGPVLSQASLPSALASPNHLHPSWHSCEGSNIPVPGVFCLSLRFRDVDIQNLLGADGSS